MRALRLLTAAWLWCALAVAAQDSIARLPPAVAQALQQAGIPETSVGIYVQDVNAERPLLAIGAERALNPASTIKLITTFAALDQLGPAYTWSTEIYTTGTLQGDVLAGDLIIKGYGDPRLTLENFWLMLRSLRARGVREIRGDLVLDRSYFAAAEDSDPAGFDNEPTRPYNTPPDALLVNFKAMRLQFIPDLERRRLSILADPPLPQVQVLNNVVLDHEPCGDWVSRLKLTALGDAAGARLLFGGNYSVTCGEKERNYSVLGHPQYVHGLFTLLWHDLGGIFAGGVRDAETPAGARLLLAHRTQTLAEIVEPRYEELFGLVRDELRRAGLEESVATGIVLTGGSAKMEGAVELAEEVFHMPVRLGVPQYVSGLVDVVSNPIHATGVGLLLYAKSNLDMQRTEAPLLAGGMKSIIERMKTWFQGNF